MSKTKKIKAIALLIIFAFSIILIVSGATMNNEDDDSSSRYQEVNLNQNFSVTTDNRNYTVEFTPTSSGYYTIYIDGASFSKMEEAESGHTTYLSYTSTSAYYNYYTYDYKYQEYLYSGTTYYLKTNSDYGETLTIYITK